MSERKLLRALLRAGNRGGMRLFRNQVGFYRLADGRKLRSGLCKGSADLVGWREIVITPEMVGRTIAQFVSVEAKDEDGAATPAQKRWAAAVARAGGDARVVRSEEELTQP